MNECMNEWMDEWMNEWMIECMNAWMNEWMKFLMDLLHNLILVNISFWKEQENHNNILLVPYKVYAYDNSRYYDLYEWIRLFNNSFKIFWDTYMSVPHWSRPTINYRPK